TDANGCTGLGSINITVDHTPNPTITPNGPTTFCANSSVDLTVSDSYSNAPYTYDWSSGGTNATKTATTGGTYEVTISNDLGCSTTASIDVAVINSTSSTTTITACDSYLWTDGNT